MAIIPMKTAGLKVSIEEEWVSYSYELKGRALVVKYLKITEILADFVFVIFPL